MEVHVVKAGRGWQWIVEGFALFRKSPLMWVVLIFILFAALRGLLHVPLLGLVAILLLPVFLVGLMEGCRALERGDPLQLGYLLSGFRTNTAPLITLGGISLVGNLLIVMIIAAIGGEAMATMMKFAAQPPATITPEAAKAVQEAVSQAALATIIGTTLSLPLMMALWFAPLLVHFGNMKPLMAIYYSFWACWKNTLPFLVYGLFVLAALILVMPIGMTTRQIDLGLWILAPLIVPTIYASYKDLFSDTPAAGENPPPA